MPRRPESALVVVAAPCEQILLLERTSPRGFWQSVTGSLEAGESATDAARREFAEETGLIAAVPVDRNDDIAPAAGGADAVGTLVDLQSTATFAIAPPWRHRYAPDVTHNLEHHFAVLLDRRVEPTLQPEEHVRGRWVTWSQAFAKVTSWTNRVALLALRRRLDG